MTRQATNADRLKSGVFPDTGQVESLLEHAADIAMHVDEDGMVVGISVNPACPSLGCLDHWCGRPISSFLTEESRAKFAERVAQMAADPYLVPRPIELNHVDNATWEFPIRYTLHKVGTHGALLMLGRDMQPVAEVQQRLLKEQLARERDHEKLRAEKTFYRIVLETSETPTVIVDPNKGRIHDLNTAAASLLGTTPETLNGNAFGQCFEGRRATDILDSLQASAGSDELNGVEAVSRRNGRVVTIFPSYFRAAGELFMVCRLVVADEDGGAGPEVTQSLSALFSVSSDAIVLTDTKGTIREANEAFLILADAADLRDVRNKPLSDFLVRGEIDLKLILDNTRKSGRLRNYMAQFSSVFGTRANVEISAARLVQRGGDFGFGFIIRDVTARETSDANGSPMAMSDEAMKNVMDLVGTASLKELVSATSDVVEKMCIETAIQLTGNNKVAVAEMLGLSRQSLYVKLHKHGLVRGEAEDAAESNAE